MRFLVRAALYLPACRSDHLIICCLFAPPNVPRNAGASAEYESSFWRQVKGVFLRRLHLARHGLGLDWHRLGFLPLPSLTPEQAEQDKAHSKAPSEPGAREVQAGEPGGRPTSAVLTELWAGRLPTPQAVAKDVRQVPGLLRGVQTWILVGLPLAAAIVGVYLRDGKSLYFLLKRTGDAPSPSEAAMPNMLLCAIIMGGYVFAPGLIAEVTEREQAHMSLSTIRVVVSLGSNHHGYGRRRDNNDGDNNNDRHPLSSLVSFATLRCWWPSARPRCGTC